MRLTRPTRLMRSPWRGREGAGARARGRGREGARARARGHETSHPRRWLARPAAARRPDWSTKRLMGGPGELKTGLLGAGDRRQALGAEPAGPVLVGVVDRGERAGRPAEQQVGQAGIADQDRAVQVGAEDPARISPLGAVAVADAERDRGQRLGAGANGGDALMILEAGQAVDA